MDEEGTLYHYGNLCLRNCSGIVTQDLIFLDKKICGFWLFKYLQRNNGYIIINELLEMLKNDTNIFDTHIQGTFKPDQFEEAFKLYRNDMSKGKVLFEFI